MTVHPHVVSRTAAAVVVALAGSLVAAAQQPSSGRWITAWGSSQQGLGAGAASHTTVRMIARVAIGGDAVRIRLDNTFGAVPLVIGKAYVGTRVQGAALAAGSNRQITFAGSPGATIPAGGSVTSDAVQLRVLARQDLAVSLYVPDAGVRPSQHANALVTSWVAPPGAGDVAAEEGAARFTTTTTSMFWLKAIDVFSATATGAVVAFGDSITDGTCATVDAYDRWTDLLAVRLALDAAGRGRAGAHKAVVNEGIGGNTITREALQPPPDSPPGLERIERDVFSHHGVTHVIVFMGTNDLRREAAAARVMAGMEELVRRVKARGLKAIGATIIPRHNRPPAENNTGWTDAKTRARNEVNRWIRTKAPFDAVLDFDGVVRDPGNADLLDPAFNCGDGIHPSPRGYYEMGAAVRLELFR
jgi:lysophospholipase L1-like esterase